MAALITSIAEMQKLSDRLLADGRRIVVVPTMGALHEGHLSLIRIGRGHGDAVVTTVFVNPTQFRAGEDFEAYPRRLARDSELALAAGTDFVFAPSTEEMYPAGYETYVEVEGVTSVLEGASRPGHFRGVATVVTKLVHIVRPHVAVFGQKDAQQVAVIRRMVADLNFVVHVVVGPTVREPDGLAMSSRNAYLTPQQRAEAPVLYQALELARAKLSAGAFDSSTIKGEMQALIASRSTGVVDYISIADADTLQELPQAGPLRSVLVSLAVRFGSTRLIDNIVEGT